MEANYQKFEFLTIKVCVNLLSSPNLRNCVITYYEIEMKAGHADGALGCNFKHHLVQEMY